MAILSNSNAISSGGYTLTNSLRFRSSASAYLSRTPTSNGNRQTWTWSAWVKRGSLGSYQVLFGAGLNNGTSANELVSIYFTNADQLGHYVVETGVADRNNISTAVYRDPSAWYHIVAVYDSTNATASNRQRLYVNGVQITSFSATSYVSQNYQPSVNSNAYPHAMGKYGFDSSRYLDGYMTEVNFIDGQALTPSSFGSTNATTGVWQPAKYTGTYGTNGFYLPFTDNSALTTSSNVGLGKDFSGNSNYWVTNNISITAGTTYDSMKDVPTLTSATVANYAVLNPIFNPNGTIVTYSNANLTFSYPTTATANKAPVMSTIGIASGKWYFEFTEGSPSNTYLGITSGIAFGGSANGVNYVSYGRDGSFNASSASLPASGATWTTGDVIGVAFDIDARTIQFYKNNVSQGTVTNFETGLTWFPYSSISTGASAGGGSYNFGQRPFTYTPPTGYVALNTYNLPTPTILQGNKYMDATIWTGDGTSPKSQVNAAGFKPDFVWIKNRSNAYSHNLYDSVRGTGSSKNLQSDTTGAEGVSANLYGYLSAFNSNGFSTTNGTDPTYPSIWVNTSGQTFVGWQWQAGQGSTSSNTSGNITSTVSVNASAGFSVVTYTGNGVNPATIGHGLGVAPKMIIVKNRTNTVAGNGNWPVYHVSTGNTNYTLLNTTAASTAGSLFWSNTTPTSTVFTVGNTGTVNDSGFNYVAYCWAEIAGFSKFTSYTGNGSADGPFVFTNFRPKFVLIKRTDAAGNSWDIFDTSRNTYNLTDLNLYANLSDAEGASTSHCIDILSNGFKIRGVGTNINASGGTYIVAAFAENPFKNALAR